MQEHQSIRFRGRSTPPTHRYKTSAPCRSKSEPPPMTYIDEALANEDLSATTSQATSSTAASSDTLQHQWNANFIPPITPIVPDSVDGLPPKYEAPEDIIRRVGAIPDPDHDDASSLDPRATFPSLPLSGNVISATFCVPYKIRYGSNRQWDLKPRPGTSALFDSFSYLASPDCSLKHTLVGWTGEIDRLPDPKFGTWQPDGTMTVAPLNKASAPIPLNKSIKPMQLNEVTEVRIPTESQRSLEKILEEDHGGCVEPVWLPDAHDDDGTIVLRDQHKWRRYGEHELFTLFHYKQNEPSDGRAAKKAYEDYERMNKAFADAILAVYRPGDIVLIHDYHLLLLPKLLRQRVPEMCIGFFLHIPFPSHEYYRCLTKRKEILEGVLGSNMIGFQAYSYTRHFASCCHRILDTEANPNGVDYAGVHSHIDVSPIGINANATLQSAFGSPVIEQHLREMLEQYRDKMIIIGRDRLDSIRGVVQKLQAFEIFLERHPEWHGRVVLIQVTSPTSIEDRDDKGDKTEAKISDLVSRINGNFGTLSFSPVHHFPQYLTKEEYFALLRMADLGLITSVRDGMNTTALEYILCQRDRHSPLIISEFSGTAYSLREAIHINPWDLSGVADAVHKALKMSDKKRKARHQWLYDYVKNNTIQHWTNDFLKKLLISMTAFNQNQTTPLLDLNALRDRYRASKRRLFMFDYDGTLTPIVKDPDAAIPSDRVIRTLKSLASNPNNAVWIISGRDQNFLNEWMGHISSIGLSAEHGSFMRRPGSTEWENLTEKFDMSWQDKVISVFDQYVARTMGSFVERKKIAVTWHYRRADPVQGACNANDCQDELNRLVVPYYPVEVMTGKANLEVRPSFVNKGEIAQRLVEEYGSSVEAEPDFVLCLGDDITDEDMFRSLRQSKVNIDHVFAVTVGPSEKETQARWHLQTPEDVVSAIAMLNNSADPDDFEEAGPSGFAGSSGVAGTRG